MLLLLAAILEFQHPTTPAGYRVAQAFPRRPVSAGYLQLLLDSRLTDSVIATIGDNAWQFPQEHCAPHCSALAHDSAKHAVLRLLSPTGHQLSALTLDSPIATLTRARLRPHSEPDYLVTVSGGGAYERKGTTVVEISNDTLAVLLGLATSPHAAWRMVPSNTGGQDILEVGWFYAVGGLPPNDTVRTDSTVLTRHHFVGGRWRTLTRTIPGYWDNDGDIPPRDSFP